MKATVQDVVPVLQPGIYYAVLKEVAERSNDQGDFWFWTWQADDGNGNDVELTATTSPRITPKTKAAKWLQGLGAVIDVGADIDFEAYYNKPIQIVVVINEAGYSRIDSVIPVPAAKAAKAK